MEDKEEFDNSIKYFQSIINNNITKYSQYKIGATFIGIKTNISGIFKMHIYIILLPFPNSAGEVPYSINEKTNLYFKDMSFHVCESFYLWLYEEMKRQKSIVILSLESNIFKIVSGGDILLSIDESCNEKKEWMDLEFNEWYEKKNFNNVFTIRIINPFLYIVPFPVKPIIIKTTKHLNNYITIIK